MNKLFLSVIFIVSLTCSCNSAGSSRKPDTSNNSTATATTGNGKIVKPDTSGIVNISLNDGKGTVKTRKDKNQTIYVTFQSEGYKKMYAQLSSRDTLSNIRFSQITMPDGKMDGPFGREMQYDLPSDGTYKLSIHENMMAGDPWSGEFKVSIRLEK